MPRRIPEFIEALRLRNEPSGSAYQQLLSFLFKRCSAFSLVWRDEFGFDSSFLKVDLLPLLLNETKSNRWPGSEIMMPAKAYIAWYRTGPKALKLLQQPGALYQWRAPKWPEDLAFYSASGCAFASVSHEKDAWFLKRDASFNDIEQNLTELEFEQETVEAEWFDFPNPASK